MRNVQRSAVLHAVALLNRRHDHLTDLARSMPAAHETRAAIVDAARTCSTHAMVLKTLIPAASADETDDRPQAAA